jgi:hypothetical protein
MQKLDQPCTKQLHMGGTFLGVASRMWTLENRQSPWALMFMLVPAWWSMLAEHNVRITSHDSKDASCFEFVFSIKGKYTKKY